MLSLRLYEPVLYSTTFLEDISLEAVLSWRRSTRRMGGYWRGSFTLAGDKSRLAKFFYERLGCHLVERWQGMPTWEGMIYEMDLTIGGTTRRRSLDLMANYVTASYFNAVNIAQSTDPASNANSIKWFGRREELLSLDGYTQTTAETARDTYLKEHAWPWARPVGAGQVMDNELVVTVCGYAFTANWRYETVGDGTNANVSDYISELITTDCEWLQSGRIGTNTLQVKKDTSIPERVYDVIAEQTGLGDANGAPWRFYVDNDRRANYQLIGTTPEYFLRGGKVYAAAGGSQEIAPWIVRPAVVRDMSYPVSKWDYSGWLGDARDFYIEEVEAGPGGLVLKTELFEEGEIMAAQAAYQSQLDRVSGTGSDGSRSNLNWKRRVGLKEDTPEWEEAIRIGKRAWQKRYRQEHGG